MALFFECMPQCAQKVFDTADIVRDGMLRQLTRTYRAFAGDASNTIVLTDAVSDRSRFLSRLVNVQLTK